MVSSSAPIRHADRVHQLQPDAEYGPDSVFLPRMLGPDQTDRRVSLVPLRPALRLSGGHILDTGSPMPKLL